MATTAPDLAMVHKQLLHLLARAEAIRDSVEPNASAQVQELIGEIEQYVERLEDNLDAQESREALKEGRIPWNDVKARLKIT